MSIHIAGSSAPTSGNIVYPLVTNPSSLGLERVVVPTALGDVVVYRSPGTASEAMVLLHGAAGSWTTWTPMLRAAGRGRLSGLVIPDLPGWGDSLGPESGLGAVDAESLAAAVVEVVRACGYDSWRVLGHSLGGFVALELAAQRPKETTEVLLVSPTTLGARGDRICAVQAWAAYPALFALLQGMRMLSVLGRAGCAAVRLLNRVGLLRLLTTPLFAPGRRVDASVVDALAVEVRPAAFARALRCARRYDAVGRWGRIECPVVSVHGDRDVFTGRNDDARLRCVIPRFTVAVLPATGHFGQIERPLLVLAELGL
ncbi:alpha/beta fold hydrolase [Diaminobutyricibacter sp. McL0608]|uniref:alpha/beta fold hydrolase n=1 Tax=Leifsonia sp. McL0608 TaxID=3143537 RepID=UPI0031F2F281